MAATPRIWGQSVYHEIGFALSLWYVDIIDQFCGMLKRADWLLIGVCLGRIGDPTKTTVFLHISNQTDPKKTEPSRLPGEQQYER